MRKIISSTTNPSICCHTGTCSTAAAPWPRGEPMEGDEGAYHNPCPPLNNLPVEVMVVPRRCNRKLWQPRALLIGGRGTDQAPWHCDRFISIRRPLTCLFTSCPSNDWFEKSPKASKLIYISMWMPSVLCKKVPRHTSSVFWRMLICVRYMPRESQ